MSKLQLILGSVLALSGCASHSPMQTVPYVDLERFMGDWYVIANIPTWIEKGAHSAVESYRLEEDGRIAVNFTFNEDSFTGERKTYTPTGYVLDETSNAIWGMQFIWPFKADYRIIYLDEDYSQTIIGRRKRDYVWIMARNPEISEEQYHQLLDVVEEFGYDITKVQRVPHS